MLNADLGVAKMNKKIKWVILRDMMPILAKR